MIREAMKRSGMVAIGRLVMSTRERVCAIEIGHPDLPRPDAQMLEIAEKIVAQQSGEFDPSDFIDRYGDALRADDVACFQTRRQQRVALDVKAELLGTRLLGKHGDLIHCMFT